MFIMDIITNLLNAVMIDIYVRNVPPQGLITVHHKIIYIYIYIYLQSCIKP